jgi:hypothetical protein
MRDLKNQVELDELDSQSEYSGQFPASLRCVNVGQATRILNLLSLEGLCILVHQLCIKPKLPRPCLCTLISVQIIVPFASTASFALVK